ncbi:MAG: hypothetical protein HUU37_09900, partial [Bdellovibrionales bacterium]|nr:hypothetical protein [Bdellovibrionales bacterium]
ARVRQAAVAALESLLRKSDPPTVLTIREDGDQISSPWYYGLNDVPWRRRTTFHLLSDGDDTILVAYTELERRTPEGWGPESETDEGYRRLGALVSGHIR